MESTFHKFPDLPYDIRFVIWQFAIEDEEQSNGRVVEAKGHLVHGWTFQARKPALQITCQESRKIPHPLHHGPGDSEIHVPFRGTLEGSFSTFFNFERDILYFPYPSEVNHPFGPTLRSFIGRFHDMDRVRHLAVGLPEVLGPHRESSFERRIMDTHYAISYKLKPKSLHSFSLVTKDPTIGCSTGNRHQLARLGYVMKDYLREGPAELRITDDKYPQQECPAKPDNGRVLRWMKVAGTWEAPV
jgi:hypothetical protein